MSISDGSVIGSRFKSSNNVNAVYGSARVGNYLMAVTYKCLVIVDINTFTFSFKTFDIGNQWGVASDASTGM